MMNPYGMPQPDFGNPSILPDSSPNFGVLNTASMPVKRAGMFGGGSNIGMAISAALNGYLAAGGNPAGIAGLQQLHQQRMLEQRQAMEAAQYQRERQDKLADAKDLYQFKLDHPDQGDSEFERVAVAGGYTPGTPAYTELMKRKADALANPIVMTPYGPMPYSSVAGAVQPQTAPPGVTFTPLDDGGPTPGASGGFPGY